MQFGVLALVAAIIFVSELPDKSMFAALVLGTKYPSFYVFCGAAAAFLTHVIIAVIAGQALTLLPHRLVEAIVALLFLASAALLLFGKHGFEKDPEVKVRGEKHSFWKVFVTAYGIVFLGEWGDITQIMTANYVAKYHAPFSVGLGAIIGLWTATGLAVTLGQRVLTKVPGKLLQRIISGVLIIFGLISAHAAIVG